MKFQCGFCSKNIKSNCNLLKDTLKDVLEVLLVKRKLFEEGITKCELLICHDCREKLKNAFDFKAMCLYTEDCLYPYLNSGKTKIFDLKMIYQKKRPPDQFRINDDMLVCRLCMKLTESSRIVFIDEILERYSKDMFEKYIPEVALNATMKPAICQSCLSALSGYSSFLFAINSRGQNLNKSWLEEQKIKTYLSGDHDIKNNPLVDVSENIVKYSGICQIKETPNHKQAKCKDCEMKLEVKNVLHHELSIKEEADILEENSRKQCMQLTSKDNDLNWNTKNMHCKFCSFIGEDANTLNKHSLTHKAGHLPGAYAEIKNSKRTAEHIVTYVNPSGLKLYQCEMCPYVRKTERTVRKHIATHKDFPQLRIYKCGICPFKTKVKRIRKQHTSSHKNNNDMFQCEICMYETKYESHFKSHAIIHKSTSEVPMYSCEICKFETKNIYSLKNHMSVHKDPSEIEMYECALCSLKLKKKDALRRHVLSHRTSTPRVFKCGLCSFESEFKNHLRQHVSIHRKNGGMGTYQCEICLYEVKYRAHLIDHMTTHKNVSELQTYECQICNYKTTRKRTLIGHLLIHKKPSEVTKYQCETCSYSCIRKKMLDDHSVVHKSACDSNMYKCKLCSFKTKRKCSVRKHMITHKDKSELIMYYCASCSYASKFKHVLSRHLLLHRDPSRLIMFQCNVCPYKTKYGSHLERHSVSHKHSTVKWRKWKRFQS